MGIITQGEYLPGPIAPVARLGETIVVKRVQKYYAYYVQFTEQLPRSGPLTANLLSLTNPATLTIATAATVPGISLQTLMEMDGFEMGQFRIKILDDFLLQVYQPQNLPRFVVKNARARLSRWGQQQDPYDQMSEMFVWQDEYPYVDVLNPTAFTLATARIAVYGFRYRMGRVTFMQNNVKTPIPGQDDIANFENIPGVGKINYVGVMAEGFVGTGFERAFN